MVFRLFDVTQWHWLYRGTLQDSDIYREISKNISCIMAIRFQKSRIHFHWTKVVYSFYFKTEYRLPARIDLISVNRFYFWQQNGAFFLILSVIFVDALM